MSSGMMGNCGHAYELMLEPSHPDSETLLDGDLVLVDCAPDYHYYVMDISRTWPVNGRYDAWQRHTYGLIVEYHKTLLSLALPGRRLREIYDEAARRMLKMYEGDEKGTAIIRNMIERDVNYYNHHVGLSAHDAVSAWRDEPLEAGMVMAVDPMVWLTGAARVRPRGRHGPDHRGRLRALHRVGPAGARRRRGDDETARAVPDRAVRAAARRARRGSPARRNAQPNHDAPRGTAGRFAARCSLAERGAYTSSQDPLRGLVPSGGRG